MDAKHTYVAIMAGGIGSRFWPGSRVARPKQFLDILGVGKSLLRLTFERFLKLCPAEHIFIVTNGMYKDLVKEHLPELSDNQILCEPSRNNTGPCVAYTAFKLYNLDPAANFIVAPSDHIILKEEVFVAQLQRALAFTTAENALCTLGIQPTRPDTGYGYINFNEKETQAGIHKVIEFKEKPDEATAQTYVDSGAYLWNAGIFIWKAENVLAAFEQHAKEIHTILAKGAPDYNTKSEQTFIDQAYPTTPSISVDYAIMENAQNIYTIPADIGWSDLGTWASLHEESAKDEQGNVKNGNKIMAIDTSNSLIRVPQDKLVVIKDLANYMVIDEGDVLLIYPKDKEQEIKGITKVIAEKVGKDFL
ncbi:MAG: mannose-1-phosphate guanylyltransferase [Saprospiraceae bacterium]